MRIVHGPAAPTDKLVLHLGTSEIDMEQNERASAHLVHVPSLA